MIKAFPYLDRLVKVRSCLFQLVHPQCKMASVMNDDCVLFDDLYIVRFTASHKGEGVVSKLEFCIGGCKLLQGHHQPSALRNNLHP